MSTQNDNGLKSFQATAALAANLRVKLTAGKLVVAVATDENCIGYTARQAFNADEWIAVALRTKPGTVKATAAGVVAVGALVYAAAGGKVDDSGTVRCGTALSAAAADGDIIEIVPHDAGAYV